MQSTTALRSYLMAGVAFAGAGIIAVNPVQPLAPVKTPVVKAEVSLSAFATGSIIGAAVSETCDKTWKCSDPAEFYQAVWNNTVFDVTAVWNEFAAAPFPILTNAFTNLGISAQILGQTLLGTTQSLWNTFTKEIPAYVGAAFTDLFAGNVLGANNNFSLALQAPLKPLSLVPNVLALVGANPIYNIANVIRATNTQPAVVNATYGILGPFISGSGGFATATQLIIDSIKGNSWSDALNWVINYPAVVFDSIVNGGYGPVLYSLPPGATPANPNFQINYVAGGLLNPEKPLVPSPFPGILQVTSRGSVSSLLKERTYVSGALCPSGPCTNPTPASPVASTPAVAAAAPAAAASAPAPEVEAAVQQDAPKVEAAAVDIDLPAEDPAPEAPAVAPNTARSEAALSNDAPAPSAGAGAAKTHRTSPHTR